MKASVFKDGATSLVVEEVQVAEPGPHELLIQTAAAGLCHSDLYHLRGVFDLPHPTILGHESSGVVVAVGDQVTDFAPGDHVITCLTAFCGTCELCTSGRSYLCAGAKTQRAKEAGPRLFQGDTEVHQFLNVSSFAEQLLVHENAAVVIDKAMPLDVAALIGCGVTTGMGAAINKARVKAGQTVAVIGCGGVGLSAIQGARISGASTIIAVDMVADKLAAATRVGATHELNSTGLDTAAAIRDLTGGAGVDHCIECVGLPATASAAVESLAIGGTATLVGLMPAGTTFPVSGRMLLEDRRVQGAYMGAENFRNAMPRYVAMYLDGRLKLDEMISSRITLDQIDEGFAAMENGTALRDVVVF